MYCHFLYFFPTPLCHQRSFSLFGFLRIETFPGKPLTNVKQCFPAFSAAGIPALLVGHEWWMSVDKKVSFGFRLSLWDHLGKIRAFGEPAAQALVTHQSFRNRKQTVTIFNLSLPPNSTLLGYN